MKSLILLVLASTLTLSASLARGPAVEDFVGIENQEPDVTPDGTEALFNFEQEVKEYKDKPQTQAVINRKPLKAQTTSTTASGWPLSAWFGILVVLAMPVLTWILTMGHLKRQSAATSSAPAETNNVTPLPTRAKSEEKDDIKKAS
jgi:hypothetical protein